jgi:hypothetical protein
MDMLWTEGEKSMEGIQEMLNAERNGDRKNKRKVMWEKCQ